MTQRLDEVRHMALVQAGFLTHDGAHRPGLLDADLADRQVDSAVRYSKLFNEIDSGGATHDLVYESPGFNQSLGTPCAYLKALPDPSADEISDLRAQIWNHGRIPTLWVITQRGLSIYNAFARPRREDIENPSRHRLGELRTIDGRLQGIQDFQRQHFDDGSFWHRGFGQQINATDRVDRNLLQDLRETATKLRENYLPSSAAHSLLGQTIFVKYLEDRQILRPEHFRQHGPSDNFADLMRNEDGAHSLFSWLKTKFNGDLFPQGTSQLQAMTPTHFDIVHRFLSGHRMRGYPQTQARLWPYSFRLIPIELVSSIYEMFAHASDPDNAKTLSVHYTRFCLVELMLSRTMQGLHETAKILDPACGSGVFLVEAFRRLAREKAHRLHRRLSRAELEEILVSQIFGVDIDRDAVSIAAFSLYLALLEMDPDLQDDRALKLPRLIADQSDDSARNLYTQDFFNTQHKFNQAPPFADKSFDLIVSNPPWTALKSDTAARDPDSPDAGTQWGFDYLREHKVPYRNPDQGFMHRARDFASPDSTITMVVGSRFLHQVSTSGRRWRESFFASNSVHSIADLSDLVKDRLLFGSKSSTRLPACVITFSPNPAGPDHETEYLVPKRYLGLSNRDEIIIFKKDTQTFPQQLTNDGTFRWKTAFRGYPRDIRLLYRLKPHPTLDHVLNEVGIRTGDSRGRGITFGKGEQTEAEPFQGLPFLDGDATKRRLSLNVADLPLFTAATVSKRSNRLTLRLPALILARSLVDNRTAAALAEQSAGRTEIVIAQSYYGISFPPGLEWLARRMNALLNSEFTLYWAFMSSSQFGVDRRLVEVSDWLNLPLPKDTLDPDAPPWEDVTALEAKLRSQSTTQQVRPSDQEAMDSAVYALYGLSQQDRLLVRDTVEHTILPYLHGDDPAGPQYPTAEQLKPYALRVCRQLNDILAADNLQLLPTVYTFPDNVRLAACRFQLASADTDPQLNTINYLDIEPMLSSMSERLRTTVADNLYAQQDMRAYDPGAAWVIKSLDRRLWTEAAALHDADLIIQEQMEEPVE